MIDPRAVEAYEKYCDDLIGYATVLSGSQEAEDIVSSAMVRVLRSTDWDRVVNPRGYLFRCVANEATSRGRRLSVGRAKQFLVSGHPGAVAASSGLDELGLFAVLSTRERAVVYLAYWQDMAIDEIAEFLGVGEGTVRGYLARARRKLRKELGHA